MLNQAHKIQEGDRGTKCAGTVLRHLVGAKLEMLLPGVKHYGALGAGQSTDRAGDFLVDDVAFHVTTAVNEALVRKCQRNIGDGLRPMIITPSVRMAQVAESLCEQAGIGGQVEIFGAEQFIAGNVYRLGKFELSGCQETLKQLVAKYNEIIASYEADPRLRIEAA